MQISLAIKEREEAKEANDRFKQMRGDEARFRKALKEKRSEKHKVRIKSLTRWWRDRIGCYSCDSHRLSWLSLKPSWPWSERNVWPSARRSARRGGRWRPSWPGRKRQQRKVCKSKRKSLCCVLGSV